MNKDANKTIIMTTKPVPVNELQRLEALKSYKILDTAQEEEFDRLTKLAALICDVPMALITLLDENRQWFKSNVGLSVSETPRELSFCQFTIMEDKIFEVTDATKHNLFAENPFVVAYPNINFYTGYPLTDLNGMNLGSLCVLDTVPKKLNDMQLQALEILAKEVVSQMVARKQNAERVELEKLFNHSEDLISIAGKDGYFKTVNPAFVALLGYSKDELFSAPFIDFIHEDDKYRTIKEFEKILKGKKILNFENRYIKKNGSTVVLNWVGNVDTITGEVYTIARDITEKVSILKELKEAKVTAEKSVKVKDEFLCNMSHEIRTPLNAIIGFNELLKESSLNAEQEKYVEIIRVASRNLIVIINDILDVSKMESGMLELEKNPIDISTIATNVINLQKEKAKEKGLKLLLSVDQDIPINVIGDSTRISQILLNLIGNAIKFTNKGYVELKIIEISRKENQSLIRFTIKDTGIGIDKEKLELIFERFSQAESSTTRIFGGTGLGLNISKMLLAMHDSTIEVQSELGKGSEFSFDIDYSITSKGESSPLVYNNSNNSKNDLAGKSILIVEDNEHNQLLASAYLKKSGVKISLAENGAEAIEKLKTNQYDWILMDLQMPVMDGFTATNIIRHEMKLQIPIIACSAHSREKERQNCMNKGMNNYISKPFSEKTLIDVLKLYPNKSLKTKVGDKGVIFDNFDQILANIEKEYGKDYVDSVLEVYRRRIPLDVAALETALEKRDFATIKAKGHLLQGSLTSLNFEIGSQLARNTELTANKGNYEETKVEAQLLINYLQTSLEIIN